MARVGLTRRCQNRRIIIRLVEVGPALPDDQLHEAFEIISAVEGDPEGPLPAAGRLHGDICLQPLPELLLDTASGGATLLVGRCWRGFAKLASWGRCLSSPRFDLPHGELPRNGLLSQLELSSLILQCEERPRMTRAQLPLLHESANYRRKAEHA